MKKRILSLLLVLALLLAVPFAPLPVSAQAEGGVTDVAATTCGCGCVVGWVLDSIVGAVVAAADVLGGWVVMVGCADWQPAAIRHSSTIAAMMRFISTPPRIILFIIAHSHKLSSLLITG